MSLKLIIGLGNPGPKYAETRHNAGFLAVDFYAKKKALAFAQSSFQCEMVKTSGTNAFILAKPTTFMNNSGQAVVALLNFYGIALADLLIIYDDMDLPVGSLRIRADGSSGGQNGMQSVIQHVGTSAIQRFRIGIGRPMRTKGDFVVDHVLDKFKSDERREFDLCLARVAEAIDGFLTLPFDQVMNRHNGDGKPPKI